MDLLDNPGQGQSLVGVRCATNSALIPGGAGSLLSVVGGKGGPAKSQQHAASMQIHKYSIDAHDPGGSKKQIKACSLKVWDFI